MHNFSEESFSGNKISVSFFIKDEYTSDILPK